MWNFTARTVHGKTLNYVSATREQARKKRDAIKRAPFIVSTTNPAK